MSVKAFHENGLALLGFVGLRRIAYCVVRNNHAPRTTFSTLIFHQWSSLKA